MYLNAAFKEQYSKLLNSPLLNDLSVYANLDAERLYRLGREAYDNKDVELSNKCEILNKVINNCVIYSSCYIGSGTKIAYGGVGVLIHPKTVIGKNCMIGTDVTIGAAPVIGNHVYVSTGSRLVGVGIKVGSFSIVGANAVVTGDVPPFSIVAGVPAKVVGAITPGNLDKYLESYLAVVNKKNTTFVDKVKAEFLESYKKYTEGHPRSSIEVNKPIGLPKSDIDILHKKLNALYQMLEEKETKVKEINDQLSKLKSSKLYRILKFIGLLKQ